MRTKGLILFGVIAALLCMYVYFSGLGDYGFIDPDEGRYSEIPREMIETGDFITPRLNYVKYFEKPIMHYWLTALSFMAFGQNEFAGRFTPVTLVLLWCVMTFLLALRVTKDFRAAVISGLILASSVLWYGISRLNITDMTLTFFFTGSLYFFRLWVDDTGRKIWLVMFYVFMALAVMSKGLIGVVLPGGIAVIYSLLTGQGKRILSRIFSPLAIAIFLAVNAVWFVPVCMANSDFFGFFFIREHFLRYTTTIHERWQPFWFFGPVLLAGLVPWTGLLLDVFRAIFGKCRLIGRKDGVLLGLWFLVPFVFFSASNSKLVTYILPCLPPIAVLAGGSLASMDGKDFRRFAVISTVILVPLAVTGLVWPRFTDDVDVAAMVFPAMRLAVSLLVFWGVSLLLLKGSASAANPESLVNAPDSGATPQMLDNPSASSATPQPLDNPSDSSATPQPPENAPVSLAIPQTLENASASSATPQPLNNTSASSATPQPLNNTSASSATPQTPKNSYASVAIPQTLNNASASAANPQTLDNAYDSSAIPEPLNNAPSFTSKCVPLLLCILALVVMYSASPAFMIEGKLLSHKETAKIIKTIDGVDDVVVFQKLMQGMNYYLERRTVTADILDELEFGAAQEESPKWFISKEELIEQWKSPKHVTVVVRRKHVDSLREAVGEPVRQWVNSADVVFTNF